MSFTDDFAEVAKYESVGFECTVDDAINNIICCEMDLTSYDEIALLAVCEDCEREGLQPMVLVGDEAYRLDEWLLNNR